METAQPNSLRLDSHAAEPANLPRARDQSIRQTSGFTLFKSLPTELRRKIYTCLFQALPQAFRSITGGKDRSPLRFSARALHGAVSASLPNLPPLLWVDRFFWDDAMPVLLEYCFVELSVQMVKDGTVERFEPAQLQPAWTHQIRYLRIEQQALRFLREQNAPAKLTGLRLVICEYSLRLDGIDVLGRGLSGQEIKDLTASEAFAMPLHKFKAEMNELFPTCEQSVILHIWPRQEKSPVSRECECHSRDLLTGMVDLSRDLHYRRPVVL